MGFQVGDWCWHGRFAVPCRIIDQQDVWGEISYRVWLPAKDTVIRARSTDLQGIETAVQTASQILHAAAAAKLADALEENLLLAPIQSSVVPLPHQLYTLSRAMSRDRIRYLLADEVGLGKTIEAGLILRELKLRGMAKRVLVVAPKGLVLQWQAEMRLHFGEKFQLVDPAELAAFRPWRSEEENLWQMHDQVICSLDSVKPVEGRRGWSVDQLASYNRERYEDLVNAGWDLVIIDEAHRMGGSTEQVARYKLGAGLAEAAPYLLLLSATPHQGKTDQFLRLMQLIDRESFPDEGSVRQERVRPYVIRTEKRASIDADGKPLFKPRQTRLLAVAWQERHQLQQQLYESVTDYVRHGYNQALAAKQRHIGFLMILMQRLVTSSTAAIRTTLDKRLAVLDSPETQLELIDPVAADDWSELDGQTQVDLAVQSRGWSSERAEVETLLNLAKETELAGSDAKAEFLAETIYRLQQEEGDPDLKVLIFTEFIPTQAMLAEFLRNRGFSVATLNGGMDLGERKRAQEIFAREARVLVSTDAGGEGLNLQFCHVVVNFDMPWNPMRIEQRIGRADRIGQKHVVRAINLVLDSTVEHRVREVLEQKLAVIAHEFGVDKAADVMDSAEVEPVFDDLYVHGLLDPSSIERECDAALASVRDRVAASRRNAELLGEPAALDAAAARQWRDHPAQFWLERAITNGLPDRGGQAARDGVFWHLRWQDGSETPRACFDACRADDSPDATWVTLEDRRARALLDALPRWAPGMPLPAVRLSGLPDTVQGVWALWQIGLNADNRSRRRFLPVFVMDDGRAYVPTARRVWDLLLTEAVEVIGNVPPGHAMVMVGHVETAAKLQGERLYGEILKEHRERIEREITRSEDAYDARSRAIGRIGLPAVREHRRRRLEVEHKARLADLGSATSAMPELVPVMMIRIGELQEGIRA